MFSSLSLTFLLLLPQASAKSSTGHFVYYNEKCPDLVSCIQAVSALTGEKYLFDAATIKGNMDATNNTELTKENADALLTQALNEFGFARVPSGPAKTYRIVRPRDARDLELPRTKASSREEPTLPATWDWMIMEYEGSDPSRAETMAKNLRNFVPPDSFVIFLTGTSKILVTAPVPVLRKSFQLLKEMESSWKK